MKSYNFLYSEDDAEWIQYSESGPPKVLEFHFVGLLVLDELLAFQISSRINKKPRKNSL